MSNSAKFSEMAKKIDHVESVATFGGAAVIVPPPGGGDPVEILMLDPMPDVAMFWANVITKCQQEVQRLENASVQGFRTAR